MRFVKRFIAILLIVLPDVGRTSCLRPKQTRRRPEQLSLAKASTTGTMFGNVFTSDNADGRRSELSPYAKKRAILFASQATAYIIRACATISFV
jgi:hypothetical protein